MDALVEPMLRNEGPVQAGRFREGVKIPPIHRHERNAGLCEGAGW